MSETEVFKTKQDRVDEWYGQLKGKRVLDIRPLTDSEINDFCWLGDGGTIPVLITFEGHVGAIPLCDPEGNGPGHLEVVKLTPVCYQPKKGA